MYVSLCTTLTHNTVTVIFPLNLQNSARENGVQQLKNVKSHVFWILEKNVKYVLLVDTQFQKT